MSDIAQPRPRLAIYLTLGRVSNLPTVWTNTLAGLVLAGADPFQARSLAILVAMTAFYVGGMYLNDAFDSEIDRRERPSRPIPSGAISAAAVFAMGAAMLGFGIAVLASFGPFAGLCGVALAATIVLYDVWHKGNALSPLVMSACRAFVYVGAAAAATGQAGAPVLIGALALAAHITGLTYAAKQEALDRIERLWPLAILALPLVLALPQLGGGPLVWLALAALLAVDVVAVRLIVLKPVPGSVPRAVGVLIAGASLVDGLVLAGATGQAALVGLCAAGFVLTLAFQRFVPGT